MSLTVVIPYYKRRHLREALRSVARQETRDFTVLVADDHSPEDPGDILREEGAGLDLRYHRFPENLGGRSLAAHWNRCVRLTDSEWVWLFSDDDIASPDCVTGFREALAENGGRHDLMRFNTEWIDDESRHLRDSPTHPSEETAEHLALARFTERRSIFVPEHIFRRAAFDRADGFEDMPAAWFTDDATWVKFAQHTGVRTIARGKVSWRSGTSNISAANPALVRHKLRAFELYLNWLVRRFPDPAFHGQLRRAVGPWFNGLLKPWGGRPPFGAGLRFWLFFSLFTRQPRLKLAYQLFLA